MSLRNISAWSIRNPVPSLVLFAALLLAGLVSFMRMQVQNDPDIEFPIVWIAISQPGAAPSELETQVTQRVEAAIRSIQGIDEINSSVSEGSSQTFVQLDLGTPVDRAVNDVRDAITQIRGNLPDGILEPQVGRADTSGDDIASFAVISQNMTLELISSMPWIERTAASTRCVIWLSISVGAAPGCEIAIQTTGNSMSGSFWTCMRMKLTRPASSSAANRTSDGTGLRIDQAEMLRRLMTDSRSNSVQLAWPNCRRA